MLKYQLAKDTSTFTRVELIDMLTECFNILIELGYGEEIPNAYMVRISSRSLKTMGTCTCRRRTNSCEIMIAKALLDYNNIQTLYNTVMHEAIHAVQGCQNHGPKWHAIGIKVTQAYPFVGEISTYNQDKGYTNFIKTRDKGFKYRVVCPNCLYTYNYKRMSTDTKEALGSGRCKCGNCRNKAVFQLEQLY